MKWRVQGWVVVSPIYCTKFYLTRAEARWRVEKDRSQYLDGDFKIIRATLEYDYPKELSKCS